MRRFKKMLDELIDKTEHSIEMSANLAYEIVEMKKKIEALEEANKHVDERVDEVAAKAAIELNKRWDEGMQQIIGYDPLNIGG